MQVTLSLPSNHPAVETPPVIEVSASDTAASLKAKIDRALTTNVGLGKADDLLECIVEDGFRQVDVAAFFEIQIPTALPTEFLSGLQKPTVAERSGPIGTYDYMAKNKESYAQTSQLGFESDLALFAPPKAQGGDAIALFRQAVSKPKKVTPQVLQKLVDEHNHRVEPTPSRVAVILETPDALVVRNAKGLLELRLTEPPLEFETIQTPPSNRKLPPGAIQKVKELFVANETEHVYNGAAAPLAFMRFFRELHRQSDISIKQAFQLFEMNGAELVKRYNGGDCLSLSENLVDALARRDIKAYTIGVSADNMLTKLPGYSDIESPAWPQALTHLRGVSHTAVVVPYTDHKGSQRFLFIDAGLGPGEKNFRDLSKDEFAAHLKEKGYIPKAITNAHLLTERSIACKNKLYVWDNAAADSKSLFCIDLLAGQMFFNSAAVAQGAVPTVGGKAELNFVAMLRSKDTFDVRVGKDVLKLTGPEAVSLFLSVAQKLYKQPPAFVEDAMSLLCIRDAYYREVMLPPASAMSQMYTLRSEVLSAAHFLTLFVGNRSSDLTLVETRASLDNATKCILRARAALEKNDADEAAARYTEAHLSLQKAVTAIRTEEMAGLAKAKPHLLIGLDPGILEILPSDWVQHVSAEAAKKVPEDVLAKLPAPIKNVILSKRG